MITGSYDALLCSIVHMGDFCVTHPYFLILLVVKSFLRYIYM